MNDVVVIGGGVSGLSAAIHLADFGMKPLLIEGGRFPAHKICGEFFSPESFSFFKKWNITPPVLINRFQIFSGSDSFSQDLCTPAGSMSRYFFDNRLLLCL